MTEPTQVRFYGTRGAGKTQALIESLLAQANERGIRVEVVYPQGEPVKDGHAARYDGSLRCADCGRLMGLEGRGGDGERWVHLEARRTVQGTRDPNEFRDAVRAERLRQIEKGYGPAHDAEHGLNHLLVWALDYAQRGEDVKASALIVAARELLSSQGEPCEMCRWGRGFGARKPLEHTCEKGADRTNRSEETR